MRAHSPSRTLAKAADTDSFEYPLSLNGAINLVERTIVVWLKNLGYTPKFG